MDLIHAVRKIMAPVTRKVQLMVLRGIVERVNDGTQCQSLQVSTFDDDVRDDVEHFQPFGLSFHIPADTEVVILNVGGNTDHPIAVGATSRAHRPRDVEEGEGGLYSTGGWFLFVDKDGVVHLGEQAGAAAVARADRVEAELGKIRDLLTGNSVPPWVPSPTDGGAALQAAAQTVFVTAPDVGADKVKAT